MNSFVSEEKSLNQKTRLNSYRKEFYPKVIDAEKASSFSPPRCRSGERESDEGKREGEKRVIEENGREFIRHYVLTIYLINLTALDSALLREMLGFVLLGIPDNCIFFIF